MDVITILNTIRDNASAQYQNIVPKADRDNMESIRAVMVSDENVQVVNEFMNTLLNKVIRTQVINKMFTNPLKSLKKGKKPLGDTVEEIYTNFLKAEEYDDAGANLLKRNLPDTKTVYHRMNSKNKFKVTVDDGVIEKAFASYDALDSYITGIINAVYNSSELAEYRKMMELMASAMKNGAMVMRDIANPLESDANAKDFIKAVKMESGWMTYPSEGHNAYLTAQDVDDVPITTFSRKDEQILIIDTATDVTVSVDVLASVFNMTVAEFNDTRKIVVDVFPKVDGYESIHGVLVDEQFFQVFDDKFVFKAFENPEGLYTNYILHDWKTVAYSILVNAVAFGVKAGA